MVKTGKNFLLKKQCPALLGFYELKSTIFDLRKMKSFFCFSRAKKTNLEEGVESARNFLNLFPFNHISISSKNRNSFVDTFNLKHMVYNTLYFGNSIKSYTIITVTRLLKYVIIFFVKLSKRQNF